MERIANFMEQLYIDKFEVTDEREFIALSECCRYTEFYESQKDKIELTQYNNIEDVYNDMVYKICKTPFLSKLIVAGLFPVMYDVWKRNLEVKI